MSTDAEWREVAVARRFVLARLRKGCCCACGRTLPETGICRGRHLPEHLRTWELGRSVLDTLN